eukprot:EG_transcript_23494
MIQARDFPEVQRLSGEELSALLNDEAAFESFFNNLAVVRSQRALHADVQRENEEMAVANLSMKAEIEALKEEIGELDQVARAQRAELEAKLARRRELQERQSPAALYRLLQTATAQAEGDSDATADAFHQGAIDLKQFLTSYVEQRKLYHLRKQKLDAFYGRFGPGAGLPAP